MAFGIHKILQKHYGDDFSREVWVETTSAIASTRYRGIWSKEIGTIVWIKQFKDDTVFLDIGSNIGIYSLAAYMVGVSAIYSVDPLPHNIFELYSTIHRNNISNIFPICARVASTNNLASVSPDQKSIIKFEDRAKKFIPNYQITKFGNYSGAGMTMQETILPGSFVTPSLNRRNIEQLATLGITDIKIDVDGAEIDVLENIYPLFKSSSFRSLAIEVRASTHAHVNSILSNFSLSESLEFRRISRYKERLRNDRDAMVLYIRKPRQN